MRSATPAHLLGLEKANKGKEESETTCNISCIRRCMLAEQP